MDSNEHEAEGAGGRAWKFESMSGYFLNELAKSLASTCMTFFSNFDSAIN